VDFRSAEEAMGEGEGKEEITAALGRS